MSNRKFYLLLLALGLSGSTFIDPADVSSLSFDAEGQEGRIGITEQAPIDNPSDNIFHITIDQPICGDEKVWLVYELNGVDDHTSVSRSINDQIAVGGYLVKERSGWQPQREEISVSWLKEGDNIVRFTVPEGANHSYEIRNLSIEIDDRSTSSGRGIVLNQPVSLDFYDSQGYVKGFLTGAKAAYAKVIVDGREVPVFNGEFETIIPKKGEKDEWKIDIEAIYPDGEMICHPAVFTTPEELDYRYPLIKNIAQAGKLFTTDNADSISFAGTSLKVGAGALSHSAYISVTTLRGVDIPPLDAGMINVTKGPAAFRFLPHNTRFAKEVKVSLPYDEEKIPDGYTVNDIKTYYFDEQAHHWVPLPTDSIMGDGEIVSVTTHFTDMINGIIQVPESPEVNAYNSTSMKGIKAANPTAGVNLMNPPKANNTGRASLGYPLNLPAGRGGMMPQLALSYNSGGGNGWLGLGWNINVPAITVETRWGVPRYSDEKETETYLMNGEQLTPLAHRSAPVNRKMGTVRFYPRVEGSFNKIERKGDSPKDYYWIVTDKGGTKYFYGGIDAVDTSAVLTDYEGNIAHWGLVEVRDLNNNFVKYHYTKVEDTGLDGGSVIGYNLYIDKITYTGHGQEEGKYSVHFLRDRDLGEDKRIDISINARYGFKQVTADLLRKVEVKFDGSNVRHYELEYEEGAFYKTLLTKIHEYNSAGEHFTTHEMEYYDEVRVEDKYQPFSNEETWSPQRDDIRGDFLNPIDLFNDNVSALGGNKSKDKSIGMSVVVGFNPKVWDKSLSVGGGFNFSESEGEGLLTMIDINGDGLSDKVYIDEGIWYRLNESAPGKDQATFGEDRQIDISGVDNFYNEESKTRSYSVEAYPSPAFVGYGNSKTRSVTKTYFTEVNGDQLVDLVVNGQVYFNSFNPDTKVVSFSTESSNTPSPIIGTGDIADGLIPSNEDEIAEAEVKNPLHDVVRLWRAPYDGEISISGAVSLIDPGSIPENADGVKINIQHNDNTILWAQEIGASDFTPYEPTGVDNVVVNKGDRIYFRVQSQYNGEADSVKWSPAIEYTDKDSDQIDPNGNYVYRFSIEDDYVLTANQEVTAPFSGVIRIDGNFIKPVTTDDVHVEIIRETSSGDRSIVWDEDYTWDEEINEPIIVDVEVSREDKFFFLANSSTNIDWAAIQWRPRLFYTSSTDTAFPEVNDSQGNPLFEFYAVPNYSIYAHELWKTEPYHANVEADTLKLVPKLSFIPTEIAFIDIYPSGTLTFSIKKEDTLVWKQELTITEGVVSPSDTIKVAASGMDSLYFEYHINEDSPDERFKMNFSKHDVTVVLGEQVETVTASLYRKFYKEQDVIFGPLYRGWGHFAYNGNEARANEPIDENLLKISEEMKNSQNPENMPTDNGNALQGNENIYDPSKEMFIMLVPLGDRQVWNGYDNYTYLNGTTISSARLGEDNLAMFDLSREGGSGIVTVMKLSESRSNSYTIGGGPVSASHTDGKSQVLLDYMDMNGDSYPDIVTPDKIQYTTSKGIFGEVKNHSFGENHHTTTSANTFSASGSFAESKSEPKTFNIKKATVSIGNGSSGVGLSGGIGEGDNFTDFTWMDINGDGLPDRVSKGGMVSLNLGYKFTAPENWHFDEIQKGESTNENAGLGVSVFHGSLSAGIGLARSDNKVTKVLQDVNGDGLQDQVVHYGNSSLGVFLNTGNGFSTTEIPWNGAVYINKSSGSSESVNAAFTAGIYIPIINIKICVNPKVSAGHGVNRDLEKISDIDGDGFPDYLKSSVDNELFVKRSTIGRTNMLKTVKRPLGGSSFTLNYESIGNTYEMPSNVWALSSVEVVDGFTGDGVDTLRTVFAYEDGFHDRHERDFYGFGKVVTTTLGGNKAPYTTVTQTFANGNYYEKGLMLTEVMQDAEGKKYVEKINEYEFRSITTGDELPEDSLLSDKGNVFPALVKTHQKFYEGEDEPGKSTSTEFEFDLLGNATYFIDHGDEGETDDISAVIEYHSYPGPFIMGSPKSIVVSDMNGPIRRREADIIPATGKVKQIRQYLETEEMAVHDLEYDEFGNLIKVTRPENHKGERLSINYFYDETVSTYVEKVSNSYGYSSEATYDFKFGQVLKSTDLNGNEITYQLDDLGRVHTIVGPYEKAAGKGYTIKFDYHPEAEIPYAITNHYDPAHEGNDLQTVIFVDGLGRVLQTKKDAAIFQGDGAADKEQMIVSGRVEYDDFGRTVKAWYPMLDDGKVDDFLEEFDDIQPTETTYDVLNRALSVILPDGAITKTQYGFGSDREGDLQFSTKTTDANGVTTEQFTDVKGRVTAVLNNGEVWTSFKYNAINEQVEAMDDLGFATISEYDWFGRRTLRNHPDAGITKYTYDMAGNLTELLTANLSQSGGPITYEYDHERLVNIVYPQNPENNVHYEYGEPGASYNRAGRIVIQSDASGAQEFFYGSLGEVVKNIRTIVIPRFDDQTYVTEWKYDTWNRLTEMTYPDGEKVEYHYNTGGLLHNMDGKKKGTSYKYVDQLGYDKFEQRIFLAYGNGTKTTYNYEHDRRRLKGMTAKTGSGRVMMDNVYGYDAVNNILSLKNNAPVPSSNLMGGSSEYIYEYDNLYRLTSATGKHSGSSHEHRYTLEMKYNSVGGIEQKTQAHQRKGHDDGEWVQQKKTTYDLAYMYGGEQPHAPKHIGDKAHSYDPNGNMTGWEHDVSGQRRQILWDEENRIRSIYDNGAAHHYTYDASGTRVLKGKSNGQAAYVNGEWKAGSGSMGNYTVYVNPYMVLRSGSYTKHFYIEGQRIVSKIGDGMGDATKTNKAGKGEVNYGKKQEDNREGIVRNLKWLGQDGSLLTAGNSGKTPPGQIIGEGSGGGSGGGGKDNEKFQYFYHPDHLGSTSYITDASGEVYQHLEYFAFGETFVEEHSNTHRTPYLFNGKELDDETGLYYYGARYYDAQVSMWLSVDPLADQSPGWTSYRFSFNNPLRYIDPDGLQEFESYDAYREHARNNGIEVLEAAQIGSQGHWLTSDREDNTNVWSQANFVNLQKDNGYTEYNSISQRADFYGWYAGVIDSEGYDNNWPGAASIVAGQMSYLDNSAVALWVGEDVVKFGNDGNRAIFNDVFDDLRELYNGPTMTGADAERWDAKTLYNEQFNVVQPIYSRQSAATISTVSKMAKGEFPYNFGVPASLRFEGNILNPQDRYNHGAGKVTDYYKSHK